MVFRKSIFAVEDINEGECINTHNVRVIRPGYGMHPRYYDDIQGQVALRNIKRGTPLSSEMIGEKNDSF